jgi:hypothetical protein
MVRIPMMPKGVEHAKGVKHVYCCVSLEQAVKDGKLAHDGTGWQINGCCGQCFILSALEYCPWCATKLPKRKRSTKGIEHHRVKNQLFLFYRGEYHAVSLCGEVKHDGGQHERV